MDRRALKRIVRTTIVEVNRKIRRDPLIALTESDIQCLLFASLFSYFGKKEPITNVFVWGTNIPKRLKPLWSTMLHSELLLPEGRIDLAILYLAAARFAFNSRGRFGGVQLEEGNHAFIEIKASRTHRSQVTSKHRCKQLLQSDINKLKRYPHLCFLVCYDFNDLLDTSSIHELADLAQPKVVFTYFKDVYSDSYLQ